MSADNGIYILESLDGFRVIHAQAIENIYSYPHEGFNEDYLKRYFGEAKLIETEEDAYKEALRLYKEISADGLPIEYGIVPIIGLENSIFPS